MIPIDTDNSNGRYVNADLHCHSNMSDGLLSPLELVQRAVDNKVEILAITDHDTIGAYSDLVQFSQFDIKMVSGIELSCRWSGVAIHVVGLGFNLEKIKAAETHQMQVRMERAERIARLLEKRGISNALQKVLVACNGGAPGRLHFARLCVSEGLFEKEADAFKKFLGAGKPGDIKSGWPELEQVVHWITQAGGIAVIAHPHKYKMTNSKLKRLLDDFTNAGGKALEVSGSGVDSQKRQYLAQLCDQYELYGSRGSDFHSPEQTWCDLGRIAALPEHVEPIWNYLEPIK